MKSSKSEPRTNGFNLGPDAVAEVKGSASKADKADFQKVKCDKDSILDESEENDKKDYS